MPATEQTARDQKLLHLIFGISGALLLLSTFWMLGDDHSREWKGYQRTYVSMENRNAEWQEIALRDEVKATNEEYEQQLKEAQAELPPESAIESFKNLLEENDSAASAVQQRYDEFEAASAALDKINQSESPDEYASAFDAALEARQALLDEMNEVVANAEFEEETLLRERKFAAADLDAVKSEVGIAVRDGRPTEELEEAVAQQEEVVSDLNLRYQAAAKRRKALDAIVARIQQPVEEIRKLIEKNNAELERIRNAIEDRKSQFFVGSFPWLGKRWLELPIVDAFNSPRKIENLWTDNLTIDYNFEHVRRFDRCTTCHQGIDSVAGYVPEHELLVSLATPDEAPAADAEPSLEAIYGLNLGDISLTGDNEVTVHAVSPNSAAASAGIRTEESSAEKLLPAELAQRASNPYRRDDKDTVPDGLHPGDVIVRIGGNDVLSLAQAKRLLTETVTWGEPLEMTIRRGAPQPYTAHPRLDLYLSSLSPHPMSTFGCTSCHEGQGNATEFKWVSHTPNTLNERSRWMDEYGWFNNHHWIYPMYPARFAESGCLKCHHHVTELASSERFPEAPAPKVTRGHHLILKYGCFGCHEINGYSGDERIGPDMRLEPNYSAAALALQGEENFEAVPGDIKDLAEQLGQNPERTVARRKLADWLSRDQKSESPVLSSDAQRLADVLADVENPGQLRSTRRSFTIGSKIRATSAPRPACRGSSA